jgi:phosphoribosylanthranilate isomerase
MFTIKICGITRPEDAQAAAAAGADAIGLNFYEKSMRYVDADRARAIIAALPPHVVKVGVFVNAPVQEVCRLYDDLKLDLIQLHGHESPEYFQMLGKRPIMKAFRNAWEKNGLITVSGFLTVYRDLGCTPQLVLLDAPLASGYGGSGKLADWLMATAYQTLENAPPLVLAGGLRPDNVEEAIRATGARAVDTASGVESQPGIKDAAAIAAFVAAAKGAFRQLDASSSSAGDSR